MKRRVLLESPYAGDHSRNLAYARAALLHSLSLGEAPMASHLLYTQVLDDSIKEERATGMNAGWAWLDVVDAVVVYEDLGRSQGMAAAIAMAYQRGIAVEYRLLGGWQP